MKDDLKYRDVLVVGADHYNTLWLVRALGMAGFIPTCIIYGVTKSFVGKSRWCKRCISVEHFSDIPNILKLLEFEQKTVLISSADVVARLIDDEYDIYSKKYFLCNCSQKSGGINFWMNKNMQLKQAEIVGMPIPRSKTFDLSCAINLADISNFSFPVLIKPEVSADATKYAFRVCHDECELAASLSEIKMDCSSVIVQEFIDHKHEILLYGMRIGDKVILPGAFYKELMCPDPQNLGMHICGYISNSFPMQYDVIKCVEDFVGSLDYQGIFSIEFILTDNNFYFLEINLRNDGTSYLTTQAGVNIPAIWTSACYGYELSNFQTTLKRTRTYCLNEINYLKYAFNRFSFVETLKIIFRTKAFSLFKFDDPMPLVYKVLYNIS